MKGSINFNHYNRTKVKWIQEEEEVEEDIDTFLSLLIIEQKFWLLISKIILKWICIFW